MVDLNIPTAVVGALIVVGTVLAAVDILVALVEMILVAVVVGRIARLAPMLGYGEYMCL